MAFVLGRMSSGSAAPATELRDSSVDATTVVHSDGVSLRCAGCSHFAATPALPVSVVFAGRILTVNGGPGRWQVDSPPVRAEDVAQAFLENGTAVFPRMDGEFSLSIVDHRNRRVYLARDRMGMRPIFWARTRADEIAWASEAKLLLPLLDRRRLDAKGLAETLQFRWLSGDRTLFAGVHRLLPGSFLALEPASSGIRSDAQRYWRFEPRAEPAQRAMSEWVDAADEALDRAVARRVGHAEHAAVLLSGGVDSPVLSQYVKRHVRRYSLITPTWEGFDNPEIPRALEYGQLIGGDHQVVVLPTDSVEEDFVELNRHFEQPARSPHAMALVRLAKDLHGFDFLVHGEGADALFGADGLRLVRNLTRKRRWLDPLGPVPKLLGAMIPARFSSLRSLRTLLMRTTWDRVRLFGDAEHEPWVVRSWRARGLRFDANEKLLESHVAHEPSMMGRRQILGLYTAVQDHLEMLDRLFGRTPLHVVNPFLAPELMELAQRLPWEYKLDAQGGAKPVMKALSGKFFPPDMAYRQKLGFPAPTLAWLMGPLQHRVQRLRAGATPSSDLFGRDLVRRLTLPADLQAVWTLVCLDEIMTAFDVEPVFVSDA